MEGMLIIISSSDIAQVQFTEIVGGINQNQNVGVYYNTTFYLATGIVVACYLLG